MRDRKVAISLYNSEGVNVVIIEDTEIFFFIMNSSFVNISSQHAPLCLILLHLSILRLSYWQSKYDEMHLSIKDAAPITIGTAKSSQH